MERRETTAVKSHNGKGSHELAVWPSARNKKMAEQTLVIVKPEIPKIEEDKEPNPAELLELENTVTPQLLEDPIKTDDIPGLVDPVRMYLSDIGKYPLLTQQQEIDLAKQMRKGEASKKKAQKTDAAALSEEEERNERQIQEKGLAARQKLIASNSRLVVAMAKHYTGRGMSFLDLIQEGNMGLIRAVDKFDPEKGFKVSTYATWWIRQAITRALLNENHFTIIPVHKAEYIRKLTQTETRLRGKLGREPTLEELAAATESTVEKVVEANKIRNTTLSSLDEPINEDGTTAGDLLPDQNQQPVETTVISSLTKEAVEKALENLSDRQRKILELRFGLGDEVSHTLEEVALELNVTPARIRQIQTEAIRKLRHPTRARLLRDYLD